MLQLRVSALCGQAAPPCDGFVMLRDRLCEPVPQDLVHVVQAPKLTSYTQSTGQTCVLHARDSAECGHASPPKRGCVFARERDCAPAPHDLVHAVHAPKIPRTQSIEQLCVLRSTEQVQHPPHRGLRGDFPLFPRE